MSDTIKIVLADDEALFRKGVAFILQRERNFEILFEAENGKMAMKKMEEIEKKNEELALRQSKNNRSR